ncbi:hypothetical protein K440107A6_09940 [Lawsonibacter asaccharolyticus]
MRPGDLEIGSVIEVLPQKQETANTVCAWPGPLFCIWGLQTDKQTVKA